MINIVKFLISLLTFILLVLFTQSAHAEEFYFQDEFNLERPINTLDPDKWIVYPNGLSTVATVRETGGYLKTFQQDNKPQFPLIISKNAALPNGDFEAEIKFQYTFVSFWGTGIALSQNPPVNGGGFNNILLTIDVWQDKSVGPNMRVSFAGQDVYTTPINTAPHVFRIDRTNQKYKVYLDNNLVFTSPDTPVQVKYIWMGNPTIQNPPVPQWTTFNVDYIRVKSLTPQKIPLIIVPGIGASFNWKTLTDKGDSGWKWMLTADGSWRQFIDSLEKAGYQKDKDYFIAFYDWRKTNDWTDSDSGAALPAKKYLAETIDKAKLANPGINKVNVVAHSMGGLVTRSYVESPNYRNDINKVFLIGSPNSGSTFAYYVWEGAEVPPNWDPVQKAALNMIIKFLSINFLQEPYLMIHDHIKGIKDLLPVGYNYLSKNNNFIDWTNMFEVNNFLKNTSNPQNTANIFTQKGVELFNITGIGQNTWEKLQVENFVHQYLWKDGKPMGSAGIADGDNTVLTSSSNLANTTGLNVASKHANLPNAATSLIFNKLGLTYTPSNLAGAPDEVMVAWVASPVTLSVQDSSGNSVGELLTDPETDKKWVFVENPSGDYKLSLTGTGSGDYHVGVDYYTATKTEGSEAQGTAISGAQLNYNVHLDPQNPQPLNLQPEDKIAPTTSALLSGTPGNNNWYLSDVNFSLSAIDNEGGVGLDKTEYSFDNSTWQTYTQPLVINTEGVTTIYYYSTDLVGNKEEIKKIDIKIDKTPPEANFLFNSDKKEIETTGKDNQSGIDKITEENGLITITDKAGHSLKLQVKEKEKPHKDKISIESISYDNQPTLKMEENKLKVEFSWDKKDNILRELEQEVKIKGDIKMTAHYNQKKNQTQIIIKEKGQDKQKINLNGLILLKLNTNQGNLEAIY